MSEREDDKGGDERFVKIDGDSKKSNRWKSLKEMKEYLRSEFEKKVDDDERNEGATYLHFAAYLGDVDATKMLIEDNAEVNAVDDNEWTALHNAAWKGFVDVAKVLIEEGADVNAVDEFKYTALHWAAQKGYVEVAKVLLKNGADVHATDEYKLTVLYYAAAYRYVRCTLQHVRCTLQLLCMGAKIDHEALKDDKTELLRPIENRLKFLRDGKRMGTSLMSNEERRFMWNLGFVLTVKHPAIAFRTYHMILSFVTFHGIFMGPGYGLGEGSIWRK